MFLPDLPVAFQRQSPLNFEIYASKQYAFRVISLYIHRESFHVDHDKVKVSLIASVCILLELIVAYRSYLNIIWSTKIRTNH